MDTDEEEEFGFGEQPDDITTKKDMYRAIRGYKYQNCPVLSGLNKEELGDLMDRFNLNSEPTGVRRRNVGTGKGRKWKLSPKRTRTTWVDETNRTKNMAGMDVRFTGLVGKRRPMQEKRKELEGKKRDLDKPPEYRDLSEISRRRDAEMQRVRDETLKKVRDSVLAKLGDRPDDDDGPEYDVDTDDEKEMERRREMIDKAKKRLKAKKKEKKEKKEKKKAMATIVGETGEKVTLKKRRKEPEVEERIDDKKKQKAEKKALKELSMKQALLAKQKAMTEVLKQKNIKKGFKPKVISKEIAFKGGEIKKITDEETGIEFFRSPRTDRLLLPVDKDSEDFWVTVGIVKEADGRKDELNLVPIIGFDLEDIFKEVKKK